MASGDLTRIRTNISALNALNALETINSQLTQTNLRLSTGKRINSSGDDPAGLAVNVLTVATQALASASLNSVQISIDSLKTILQAAGSTIERLRIRNDNLNTMELNLRAANSRIMDADLASEQLTSAKLSIL